MEDRPRVAPLKPGDLSGTMDQREKQQSETDAASARKHAAGLAEVDRQHKLGAGKTRKQE
jgi:hypothetical protein